MSSVCRRKTAMARSVRHALVHSLCSDGVLGRECASRRRKFVRAVQGWKMSARLASLTWNTVCEWSDAYSLQHCCSGLPFNAVHVRWEFVLLYIWFIWSKPFLVIVQRILKLGSGIHFHLLWMGSTAKFFWPAIFHRDAKLFSNRWIFPHLSFFWVGAPKKLVTSIYYTVMRYDKFHQNLARTST